MTSTYEQLAEQRYNFRPTRARLAEQLAESLVDLENDETRKLWAAEAVRRRDEIRSGSVAPIPGDRVRDEVRRVVGR